MPRCPYCNKEINKLNCSEKGTQTIPYFLDRKMGMKLPCYDHTEFYPSENPVYTCPKCGECITHIENEAMHFLVGE